MSSEVVNIDPVQAFQALQEYHGTEMGRLAGDVAAKNAYISRLQQEIRDLKVQISSLDSEKSSD